MFQFFRCWRWKAGCGLLLAVVGLTAAMSVRSHTVREALFSFEIGNRHVTILSHNGGVTWWEQRQVDWLKTEEREALTVIILNHDPKWHFWCLGLVPACIAVVMILWPSKDDKRLGGVKVNATD